MPLSGTKKKNKMQKENSYLKLKEYFEYIAEKSTKINDFAGYFQRDVNNKITSYRGMASPYLAIFDYKKGYLGENDNTIAAISMRYAILRTDVPFDDIEAQYRAIDECELIAKSVNSRLRYDHHKPGHLIFNAFLKDRTDIVPIDVREVGFGVEVQVFFKNPENLALNPDEWTDIDSVCG